MLTFYNKSGSFDDGSQAEEFAGNVLFCRWVFAELSLDWYWRGVTIY